MRRVSFMALFFCLAAAPAAATDNDAEARAWRFRVFMDDTPIGYHRFELRDTGNRLRLESEARFDVKFLFITAYRYRHSNVETWQDGCVRRLAAKTVTNGETQVVTGAQQAEHFVVEQNGEQAMLPGCVMTFAYWNPAFLNATRLLNPQTGEYLEVDITQLPEEPLDMRGETQMARHFRIVARGIELELWYSRDDRWLALESATGDGRRLRYELISAET